MKLLTYRYQQETRVGVLNAAGDGVYPLETRFSDVQELIQAGGGGNSSFAIAKQTQAITLEKVTLLAPIPRPAQDILCLGINFMAHAEESARYKKTDFGGERQHAVYFSKRVDNAVACGDVIPSHSGIVDSLDYEVELAVILGRDARDVPRERAFEYVFGYTILNDISARNLQTRHKQWYFGKSLDGFCPMGPWVVTADEFSTPPSLQLRSRVNGELRQDSSTDLLIFDIPHVIAELSQGMTLRAGSILSMGTPAGVGMGFQPPRFLKPGDRVDCEIDGIGVLWNTIGV